jgi:hypothetical protein
MCVGVCVCVCVCAIYNLHAISFLHIDICYIDQFETSLVLNNQLEKNLLYRGAGKQMGHNLKLFGLSSQL